MSDEYRPVILNLKHLRSWWLIPVLTLLGGLIGFGAGYFFKPVYKATAILTTFFDFRETSEITELMLDGAMNHVGELAWNPMVIDQVIASEADAGNPVTLEVLKECASIERRLTSTLIKVSWSDPAIAARMANSWGSALFHVLQEAYKQAILAEGLGNYRSVLEACLVKVENPADYQTQCNANTAELTGEIEKVSLDLADAKSKSLGLSERLNISQFAPAAVPNKPLYYSQETLLIAGAFLGLVISIILLEVYPGRKLGKES